MKYFIKQNILDDDKSYWSSNTYVSGTQITDVNGFFDDDPRTKTDKRYTKIGDGWKWGVYEDSSWYATYIPSAAETSVRAVRSLAGPNSKVTTKSIDKVIKNTKEASNGLTQQDLINLAIRAASGETPNLDPESPFYSKPTSSSNNYSAPITKPSNTSSKHTFKVLITWNNPNCRSCPFPLPSVQNGTVEYFYEPSGSYRVKPVCPSCGKTQYKEISGFTENIGTSKQGSKVVTITCN
jgi:hypothetical protein